MDNTMGWAFERWCRRWAAIRRSAPHARRARAGRAALGSPGRMT